MHTLSYAYKDCSQNSRCFFMEFFTEISVIICATDKYWTNKNAIWQICFLILFCETYA